MPGPAHHDTRKGMLVRLPQGASTTTTTTTTNQSTIRFMALLWRFRACFTPQHIIIGCGKFFWLVCKLADVSYPCIFV